jgi:hypothetical protein
MSYTWSKNFSTHAFSVNVTHLVKHLGQHWQYGLQVCAWGDELKRHKILQKGTQRTPFKRQ